MKKIDKIDNYIKALRLPIDGDRIIKLTDQAAAKNISFMQYTEELLTIMMGTKNKRALEKRIKEAQLPVNHELERFDCSIINGMSPVLLAQLKELTWVDQLLNLIIMGPPGVGKTFLCAGLCHLAANRGYKAYFRKMEALMSILSKKDINRAAAIEYRRLIKADLLIIDDIMMIDPDQRRSNVFFHFINEIYESTAIVVTTNKSPKEWVDKLGDEVLTAAVLDRLLHHSEIIQLSGESQRKLKRKESFFKR